MHSNGAPFLFRATNHHSAECGSPPHLDEPATGSNVFRSYFENEHGEQWILTHDATTDEIAVFAGDVGWAERLTVKPLKEFLDVLPMEKASELRSFENEEVVCGTDGPVILGKSEKLWLNACMAVVGSRRRK